MELYLVRHTSVQVPAGFSYGQTDVPLNESFPEEAKPVCRQLEGLVFDAVYTSPLIRCVRLAEFCGFPDARKEKRLMELDFGEWEMKSWDEVAADPYSRLWFDDWIHVPTKNGESLQQQYDRLVSFLDALKQSDAGKVCLFTHGGILTCANVYAGIYDLQEAMKHVPPYGSVIKLEI